MTKLEVSFAVGDKVVDSVDIKTPSFLQFVEYITTAHNMKAPSTFEGRLRRIRMEKQVDYFMNGKAVPFTVNDILKIPLVAARKIAKSIDLNEELFTKGGKIIRDGDGVATAIGFELGMPIAVANGKEPISELEFIAETYGDVEDVLAANDGLAQTIALLRTVAKPVHKSLTSMPSWAIDKISIADGMAIANNVTSRFLGNEQEDRVIN